MIAARRDLLTLKNNTAPAPTMLNAANNMRENPTVELIPRSAIPIPAPNARNKL